MTIQMALFASATGLVLAASGPALAGGASQANNVGGSSSTQAAAANTANAVIAAATTTISRANSAPNSAGGELDTTATTDLDDGDVTVTRDVSGGALFNGEPAVVNGLPNLKASFGIVYGDR
ncbi:hypothetical protein JMM61_16170 [Rhodovulum sulfidophilum]|uniref:hypothetical protein n=1 Tax=Rhodovulum sulfidophilum TaxID=35806 RepID=UPI001923482E|nr:hypothetical protein [Rhodovulum sulfidophilum]MBL3566752.1 hypothetical protein [Rhodovulum sulfidophilum]MBL3586905.1 hypothetical protein [Rhodovulum sulfidophilum]